VTAGRTRDYSHSNATRPDVKTKVEVKDTLFSVLRHEKLWENGSMAPSFLYSALDEGELPGSHPYRFIHGETAPVTDCVGGWLGPRDALILIFCVLIISE
jgi:hypothetical protein